MTEKSQDDPFRADAALVYRFIRDHEPVDSLAIATACFPFASDGPPSSVLAIQKRSLRRVYDSIVWLRHQGVPIFAQSNPNEPTWFVLRTEGDVTPPPSPKGKEEALSRVTGELPKERDAMGLWHADQ